MSLSISRIKKRILTFLQNRIYLNRNKKGISFLQNRISLNQNKNIFIDGYKVFSESGVTPQSAYYALINLYCLTNGKFNEDINRKIISFNPPLSIKNTRDEFFGKLDKADYEKINITLNNDGYYCFDKQLPAETCKKLYDYALKNQATGRGFDSKVLYNPNNPISEIYRYDFNMVDLINNEDIQQLIMNPALINVARNYLGCEPVFDFPGMWWSAGYKKEALSDSAQLYHFDMDRIKWLKIFFYINDVTPENGPHCYIKHSHKPGNKPMELLKRGYVRIPDEDLKKYYKQEDFIELCGDAGSIIAGDTKCWHKGKHLTKGHRLVMQLEYTSSLFGANYPKMVVKKSSDAFKEFCKNNSRYSSNIHFNN